MRTGALPVGGALSVGAGPFGTEALPLLAYDIAYRCCRRTGAIVRNSRPTNLLWSAKSLLASELRRSNPSQTAPHLRQGPAGCC